VSRVAGLAKATKEATAPVLRGGVCPLGATLRAAAQGRQGLRPSKIPSSLLALLKERGRVRVKDDGSIEVAFTVVKGARGKGTPGRGPRPDDVRQESGKG